MHNFGEVFAAVLASAHVQEIVTGRASVFCKHHLRRSSSGCVHNFFIWRIFFWLGRGGQPGCDLRKLVDLKLCDQDNFEQELEHLGESADGRCAKAGLPNLGCHHRANRGGRIARLRDSWAEQTTSGDNRCQAEGNHHRGGFGCITGRSGGLHAKLSCHRREQDEPFAG